MINSLFETVRFSVSISPRNLYNSLKSIKEICVIGYFKRTCDIRDFQKYAIRGKMKMPLEVSEQYVQSGFLKEYVPSVIKDIEDI